MWRRKAERRLGALWRQFPAVLILGARQVGKTTLAKQCFPDLPYCDLEEPSLRERFQSDPTFQIEAREEGGLILDEAQAVPELFASLRGIIDRRRKKNGRFLLLGSAQPTLLRDVSETLAGRVGILDLDPLTVVEARTGTSRRSWRDVWLHGGFPDALGGSHREWWEAYLRTYVERDLPSLGLRIDALLLRRLLTMLAHSQGGLLNASRLGSALGISYHTVQRYIAILEQTFLVRRLPPYFRNIGKRLTKSPKIYLRDTGLLHHLLNIDTLGDLDSHPARGASWETFLVEDLIRRERLEHPHTQFYFWRTATGIEVDLVLERGREFLPLEIKTGRGLRDRAVARLTQAATDLGAPRAWILDQAPGTEPVTKTIERRGIAQVVDWLPESSKS
ncbi:MAG TPA: ATP-binding protein [Planctomycetes bacterium]|nr:ATP-binding protein [Planctomycetota bacterium]